jgi:excinuclease UvrABC ATPase subunit
MNELFENDEIEITGASENNLKCLNLTVPKGKLQTMAGIVSFISEEQDASLRAS